MIIINGPRIAGNLLGDLARAEELARDLARISDGYRPSEHDLAAAPILNDWQIAARPSLCLRGTPQGHPYCRGTGTITSAVWVLAPGLGWARTLSRYWRLGRRRDEEEQRRTHDEARLRPAARFRSLVGRDNPRPPR